MSALFGHEFSEYQKEPQIETDDLEYDPPLTELASKEIKAFVNGSLKNILTGLGHAWLNMHGLGLAYNIVEGAIRSAQWYQMVEGIRGAEAEIPVLVGSGIELDLSLRLDDEDGLPIVACCALSGDSPVGTLVVDSVEVGPGDRRKESERRTQPSAAANPADSDSQPMNEPVRLRRPVPRLPQNDTREMISALEKYAKDQHLAEALRQNLDEESADYMVWCTTRSKTVVLIYLSGNPYPWYVKLDVRVPKGR